jgi:hypothetical protein
MYVAVAESFTSRARVASYEVPETVPKVRIPRAPPHSLKCRETSPQFLANHWNWRVIARIFRPKWTGESVVRNSAGGSAPFSPEAKAAVPFSPLLRANVLRSQSDDAAKAYLTFGRSLKRPLLPRLFAVPICAKLPRSRLLARVFRSKPGPVPSLFEEIVILV